MHTERDGSESLTPEEVAQQRATLGLDSPPVVTRNGLYRTRDGLRAVVGRTNNPPPYSCYGYIMASDGSVVDRCSWAASGRYRAAGESPRDIVSKWHK